jgi:hypothetical protein
MQAGAPLLAGGIVGFCERDRDDPLIVTGQDFLAFFRMLGQEVEYERLLLAAGLRRRWQLQLDERIYQLLLDGCIIPYCDQLVALQWNLLRMPHSADGPTIGGKNDEENRAYTAIGQCVELRGMRALR